MFSTKCLVFFCILSTSASFWFFGGETVEDTPNTKHENSINTDKKDVAFKHVPFEVKTVDDRLLKETYSLGQFSQLDSCFHRVMSELEGSCISMSEEELSKLSVQLLNCQSMVEGRKIYPCTSDMELKECTSGMDETVWNSYQIVSNRARSVCYQIRHQQFRMKTELTVNKLVETSEEQLKSLREMEVGHDILRQLTMDVMMRVEEGQSALLNKQLEMSKAQEEIELQMEENKKKLSDDQKLISMENMRLMQFSERIQDKLDNATEQISIHTQVQTERHKELMGDIGNIATETKQVISALDEGKLRVKVIQDETKKHFEEVTRNLAVINGSVAYLAELIHGVKHFIDEKINILSVYIDLNGKDVELLYSVAAHTMFLFGLLVVLLFFNMNAVFKLMLMFLVFCNMASLIHCGKSLSLSNLTSVLMALFLGYYFIPMTSILNLVGRKKAMKIYSPDISPKKERPGLTSNEIQMVIQALEKMQGKRSPFASEELEDESLECPEPIPQPPVFNLPSTPSRQRKASSSNSPMPQNTPKSVRRRLLGEFEMEESLSKRMVRDSSEVRTSTPLRHRSPSRLNESLMSRSMRAQCLSLTKNGTACKLSCQEGSVRCHVHSNLPD